MYLLLFEVFPVLLTGLKWLRNNLSTTWYDSTLTGQRGKLYEKNFFSFDFHIFYLNTDASVVEFFFVIVFQ